MTKRFLSVLFIFLLLVSGAFSASALSKEDQYTAALNELAAYVSFERDNISIDALIENFTRLATYKSGQSFLLYVMILSEIEKEEDPAAENAADLSSVVPIYLNIMRMDPKFTAYLEEDKRFGTIDDLENYYMGRLCEKNGDRAGAYNHYRNANAYMDSMTRITLLSDELFSEQYSSAVKLLSEGRYEEAYLIFRELYESGFNCETLMNTSLLLWESTRPKEHKWIAADCTTPKTCSECGETDGSALGHDYTNATCADPATCLRCGHTLGTKLGHSYSEATCTKAPTCIRCGLTSGYKLEHDYTDATCTSPRICKNCAQTSGAALGHNFTNATCTSPKTCYVCGKTEGSPLSHNWTNATCISLSMCLNCGKTTGSYASHTWRAATYDSPETCTTCSLTRGAPKERPLSASLSSYEVGSRIPNSQVTAYASSCEPAGKYGTYYASNANDSNTQTEWVEGQANGNGAGERLTFNFSKRQITGFVIQAGMFRSKESFGRNSRPATIMIHMDGGQSVSVTLNDVMKNQIVLFSRPVSTSSLSIELRTFYNSGVNPDFGFATCITDVWILQN